MTLWQGIVGQIQQDITGWLTASLAMHVVWIVVILYVLWRNRTLSHRLHRLTAGASGASLERVLVDHLARVEEVDTRLHRLEDRASALEAQIPFCVQRTGLVRYDAFDDVGGQQSFSLALLDAQHSGIILTSVFSRSDVRVYAKALQRGQPSHPLSEEEIQAIHNASHGTESNHGNR